MQQQSQQESTNFLTNRSLDLPNTADILQSNYSTITTAGIGGVGGGAGGGYSSSSRKAGGNLSL